MSPPATLVERASALCPPELEAMWRGGAAVVGYSCVSTPRELLDAAGVLPYRIRALGSTERERADAVLSRFNCSYCRSCLQLGLQGDLDFLDGLIETNGCDHLRGMFENWQHARPDGFFHYLRVPHLVNEETERAFTEELGLLRDALARRYDAPLDDGALRAAVERQSRLQRRLRRLLARRELDPPGLSGAEALALVLLESALPLPVFEDLVDRALAEPPARPAAPRARVVLGGSATDELELVAAIEQLGAAVVADSLCYGTRAFRPPAVDLSGDALQGLARAYLHQLLCPRMFAGYAARLDYVERAARGAGVHGVLLVHNKFCDLHGVDNARLRIDLEQRGLPVLVLEKEYGAASDLGRIRTRVQAFLERIGR